MKNINRIILLIFLSSANLFAQNEESMKFLKMGIELEDKGGDQNKILEYFSSAIKADAKNAKAFDERGELYILMNKYDLAVKDLEIAVNLGPDEIRFYRLGALHLKMGENTKAVFYLTRAIDYHHENYEYYFDRALAYLRLGKDSEAILDFNKAIKIHENDGQIHPEDHNLYYDRGLAHLHLHHYKLAMNDFNQAINMYNGSAEYYTSRGQCYQKMDQHEQAVKDFTTAIKLGDDLDNFLLRGLSYDILQKYDLAEQDFKLYLKVNPDNSAALFQFAEIELHAGKYKEAIEMFNQILMNEPQNKMAYFHRGMAHFKLGQKEEACTDFLLSKKYGNVAGYNQMKDECK